MTKIPRSNRKDPSSRSAKRPVKAAFSSHIKPSSMLFLFSLSLLSCFVFHVSTVSCFSAHPTFAPVNPTLKQQLLAPLKATSTAAEQETDSSTTDGILFVDNVMSESSNDATETPAFPHSERQLKSVHSNAPAVLLKSGPGTGKTYALASRVAHLIHSGSCRPEQMVVLSFTNRDAHSLKQRALHMYKQQSQNDTTLPRVSEKEVMNRLWSGTIHAFASSIIRSYSRTRRRHFQCLSAKEMRARVDQCLRLILEERHYGGIGGPSLDKLKAIRIFHRDALADVRQARGALLHQVCRCLDLWKEAGVLPPPAVSGLERIPHNLGNESVRDNCLELAMRLGISQNVAKLAMELYSQYQRLHESYGTADPSDLAAIATNILTSDSKALAAFRTKLKHVILDEYQDVSVTQHALIRVIILGIVDETKESDNTPPPVLAGVSLSQTDTTNVCFQVPRLFCSGDSNQSIYGWRGAAPYISTEGFQRDYPQGIVVSLDESYRLSNEMWNAANGLIDPQKKDQRKVKPSSTILEQWSCKKTSEPEDNLRALFSKASKDEDELSSPIRIQGLWDAREEAKYIASTIRKRSKARMKRCSTVLGENLTIQRDPTDVAVMVRSNHQLALIKEALLSVGIPFVVCTSQEDSASPSESQMHSNLKLMDMKPVVLMTMHRAKGEEFDDVYLAHWSGGSFPHPTSVSANRVSEERRLAFVAISRARHNVIITHSFVQRVLHHGPNLTSKYVTAQVEPSQFLYELVPEAKVSIATTVTNTRDASNQSSSSLPSVVWYRGEGVKDSVAGRDVPEYFAKSYASQPSYTPAHLSDETVAANDAKDNGALALSTAVDNLSECHQIAIDSRIDRLTSSDKELLRDVENGLNACEKKVRGAKGKFKTLFRDILRDRFDLKRGSILVLPKEEGQEGSVSSSALFSVTHERLKRKPLSQATAIELGLHICYGLLSPIEESKE